MDVDLELTRDELLDVALLDVIGDDGFVPTDAVIEETSEWCIDERAWTPEALVLLEQPPTVVELEERLRFLHRLGMVRFRRDTVELTRAGRQMWEGFPWEYVSDEER